MAEMNMVEPLKIEEGRSDDQKRKTLANVWLSARPIEGTAAESYLKNRYLEGGGFDCLRFHPSLGYYEEGAKKGEYPALLARVVDGDGKGVNVQRFYLSGIHKAEVESPKKLMEGLQSDFQVIRLGGPREDAIAVAEGLETALAVRSLFDIPCWATVSAGSMEKFVPPAGVKKVEIYADNDESFTGQKAAYLLAFKLKKMGLEVKVYMPDNAGWDWNDVLIDMKERAA